MSGCTELRYTGVPLTPDAGMVLPLGRAGLLVPDPDDPARILVVPLSAAKIVFDPAFQDARPNVPEGW